MLIWDLNAKIISVCAFRQEQIVPDHSDNELSENKCLRVYAIPAIPQDPTNIPFAKRNVPPSVQQYALLGKR